MPCAIGTGVNGQHVFVSARLTALGGKSVGIHLKARNTGYSKRGHTYKEWSSISGVGGGVGVVELAFALQRVHLLRTFTVGTRPSRACVPVV